MRAWGPPSAGPAHLHDRHNALPACTVATPPLPTCTRAMVLLMALYRISQAAPDSDSSTSAVTPSLPNTQLRKERGVEEQKQDTVS